MEDYNDEWDDEITQRRDFMFDIPLNMFDSCLHALKDMDAEWMTGEIYFVACKYNDYTARFYVELKHRDKIALSQFGAKKVFRSYLVSLDYVQEIKSHKVLYEYGIFQSKLSRVPTKEIINKLRVEELTKLKPYLTTLVNERIKKLAKEPEEMAKVQSIPLDQDEGNRFFFAYVNNKANEYIKANK